MRMVKYVDQRVVFVDQFCGCFFAHTWHAVEIVARVAAQRRVVCILLGRDPGAPNYAGLVVERVVADAALVVKHLDVRIGD